jgi:hypothetical protein
MSGITPQEKVILVVMISNLFIIVKNMMNHKVAITATLITQNLVNVREKYEIKNLLPN